MSDFDRRGLVYGLDPFTGRGTLAFLPRQYAQERASEVEALKGASTLSQVVALDLPHLGDHFDDYRSADNVHQLDADYDDEPYNLDGDISQSEGDFPPMPAQWAVDNDLFPPEVLPGIGTVEETVFNGPFLKVDPGREAEVIAHLTAAGYRCERDDVLVLGCRYTDDDLATALRMISERADQ